MLFFWVQAWIYDHLENAHYKDESLIEAFRADHNAFARFVSLPAAERTEFTLTIRGRQEHLHVRESEGIIYFCCASVVVNQTGNHFESWVSGKGFAYSQRELPDIVDVLEDGGSGEWFHPIEQNWYIFFDNGYSKPE